jgi:alpha-D-ribose 1-methylphosphonate 5-triphosphate synthase subunit PhnH
MSIDLPGFADPVLGAQACFRAVLDAMARPGRITRAGAGLTPPAPLDQATAAVMLTLVDGETGLFLAPEFTAAAEWIGFHCGAAATVPLAHARFAVCERLPGPDEVDTGSDEAPERAATVILPLAGLGTGRPWRLSGPGLASPAVLAADGLPAGFARLWAANHALFPRGYDLILCSGDRLAALPRSVRIEEA